MGWMHMRVDMLEILMIYERVIRRLLESIATPTLVVVSRRSLMSESWSHRGEAERWEILRGLCREEVGTF
jgi:hypothetical protein